MRKLVNAGFLEWSHCAIALGKDSCQSMSVRCLWWCWGMWDGQQMNQLAVYGCSPQASGMFEGSHHDLSASLYQIQYPKPFYHHNDICHYANGRECILQWFYELMIDLPTFYCLVMSM
jgi:hypothetical protein